MTSEDLWTIISRSKNVWPEVWVHYELRSEKVRDAVEIFKLNVEMFPKAGNTYDSLAEAYMNLNERELAISNYKKSLELDPKNTNAIAIIKRLEAWFARSRSTPKPNRAGVHPGDGQYFSV